VGDGARRAAKVGEPDVHLIRVLDVVARGDGEVVQPGLTQAVFPVGEPAVVHPPAAAPIPPGLPLPGATSLFNGTPDTTHD